MGVGQCVKNLFPENLLITDTETKIIKILAVYMGLRDAVSKLVKRDVYTVDFEPCF